MIKTNTTDFDITNANWKVRAEFLSRYSVKTVGGSIHQEYWIPAEDLPEFNRNIVGLIEVISEFRQSTT